MFVWTEWYERGGRQSFKMKVAKEQECCELNSFILRMWSRVLGHKAAFYRPPILPKRHPPPWYNISSFASKSCCMIYAIIAPNSVCSLYFRNQDGVAPCISFSGGAFFSLSWEPARMRTFGVVSPSLPNIRGVFKLQQQVFKLQISPRPDRGLDIYEYQTNLTHVLLAAKATSILQLIILMNFKSISLVMMILQPATMHACNRPLQIELIWSVS